MGQKKGFALLDEETMRQRASMGGKAAHAVPKWRRKVHEWTRYQAHKAGKKGGATTAARYDMAVRGKIGGLAAALVPRKPRTKDTPQPIPIPIREEIRMKIVTIVFAKGGKTAQISVEGACGPECQELTRPIEEGLGIVTSNVPTEDMFRAVEVVSQEQ